MAVRRMGGSERRGSPGRRRGLSRVLLLLVLLLGVLVVPTHPAPPADAAQVTRAWTGTTGTNRSVTSTMPSGLTVTVAVAGATQAITGLNANMTGVGGTTAMYTPDLPTTTPFLNLSNTSGMAAAGTMTVTFSRPVRNPVLHFAGIGGSNTWARHTRTASQPAGVTFTELPGSVHMMTDGTVITLDTSVNVGSNCTTDIAGCGSMQATGEGVTSLTFSMNQTSGSAGAQDAYLFAVSVDEDLAGGSTALPAPYGTASHVVSNITLGPAITADATTALTAGPAAPAQAVDTNDANPTFPALSFGAVGSPYTVAVPVTGLAGSSGTATLAGWIDFNRNGTFDAGERAQASVTVGPGSGPINLSWPSVPAGTVSGPTWARFRYSYNATHIANATGLADSGEVEDYPLTIVPSPPTITGPTNGSTTTDNTPTISGTAEPNTTVTITSSTGAAVCTAAVDATGSWSCTPAAAFPDGAVTISGTTTSPGGTSGPGNQVTFTVDTTADVEATKSAAPPADGTLNPGEQFTYTVGATNDGPAAAANTVVSDTLPAPLSFVSSPDGCTAAGQVVTCGPVATLAAGASASFDFVVELDPAYTGDGSDLANAATASSDTGDNVPGNNTTPPVPPPNFSGPSADLSVTKTAPATVTAGTNATWELDIANGGPSNATGVTVNDTLPAGLTFVSATPDICTAAGQEVTCTVGSLARGGATSISIVTAVDPGVSIGAVLTNTATVSAATPDPVPGNDTATADAPPVGAVADVSIAKTPPATVTAGENATWTLTVDNAGPSAASAVVVTDTLPDGTAFVSSSPAVCTAAGPTVTCDVGSVAVSTPVAIALTTAVAADVAPGTVLTNTATVTTTSTDPDPTDDTASADSPPVGTSADLSIVKTPPAVVTPGQNAVWRITVTNNGPSDATGVVFTDTMGAGMSFVSFGPASCTTAGQVVTCPIGDVAAGGVVTGDLTVLVAASVPAGSSISNTAEVTADTTDPNLANNIAADVIAPPGSTTADLSISKAAPTTVTAGTDAAWTITVANAGPSDAAEVLVTDTLPAGVSFVSSTPACTAAGQEVTCALGTLAAAGVTTISLTTAVAATVEAGTVLENTATVASAASDPDPADNTATVDSPSVTTSADLSVAKSAPAAIVPGTDATWTITVTNGGPSDAQEVTISDTLAPGLSFVSASPDVCTATAGLVTCELGTVAAGAEVAIDLTTAVAASVPDGTVLTNAARVDSATADPDPADNTTPDVPAPPAAAEADLSVTKAAPAEVVPGTNATWTITVTNSGPSDAQEVTVSDALDASLSFLSSTPACTASGQEVTCGLGTVAAGGEAVISLVTAVPADVPAGTVIANTADVTSTTTDPDEANNTATATATATPSADVAVTKAAPAAVVPGTNATWTITVTNAGPSDAQGVVVTDLLDPALTFVSSDPAICTASGQDVSCPVGTVAAGASVVIEVATAVAASVPAGAVITNAAALTSDTPDPDPADNTPPPVPAPPAAPSADLAVTKTPPDAVVPGTNATWTITVTNNGPSDALGVRVSDTLDPSLTFVSSDPAGCVGAGQVVTCTVGTLAAGASATIDLTTAVAASVPEGTEITNAAAVTSDTPDPDPASNVTPPVPAPPAAPSADLAVVKGGPVSIVPGTEATWLVTVTNKGPSDAQGVVVTDTLGPSTTFVSATPPCEGAGQAVMCELGALAAGAAVSVEITVLVDQGFPAGESISDEAEVTSDTADPVADNNAATALAGPATPDVDVAITNTAPVSVTAGTRVTWTVQVLNNGPSQADGVVVSDTLDPHLTFVSAAPPCSVTGQALTCNLGDLPAAGAVTIDVITDVAASVPAGTVIANTATVDTVTPDTNAANDTATATAPPVTTAADVSVTKSPPASVVPGTNATWTITVANAGPSDALDVTVTDTLAAGLTFVSSSPAICSAAGQAVTCDVGTVPPGVEVMIGLTTAVSAGLADGTVLTNAATATSGTPDPDPADNTTPDVPAPPAAASADLAITKAAPAGVVPGTDATWTIAISNAGPSDAQDVTVTETLDPGLSFVSSSPAICSAAGQEVTCDVGTLTAGSSVAIGLTTRVAPDVPAGTVITNAATATSTTADPNQANNTTPDVPAPPAAPSADLAVVKGGPASVVPGTEATWLVTVLNNGPSDAQEVSIVDTVGDGTTFVSADPATCTAVGQQVRCDVGTLAAGATTSIEITVTVDQALPPGSVIANQVVVGSATPDPDPADNTAEAQAAPATPDADLAITKTAPSSATAGSSATWTIQVVNNGPSQAVRVVVSDTLDPSLTFVSATPPCAAAGQVLTCDLGDLAAAQAVSIDVVTTVAADVAAGTVIANTADVASAETDDPDTTNNTATATAPPVISSADLSIEKAPPETVVPGTNAVWTITVTNDGPSDALDVVVTDTLDANLTFVSSAPAICAATGQEVSCSVGTVAAGGGVVIEITTAVASSVPEGAEITNAAAVQASTPDPDPTDNTTPDVPAPGATPIADLEIIKGPPAVVVPGQEVTWLLTVLNNGPSDAVDVSIEDELGTGTTFVSADPAMCTTAGQVVACDIGTVAAGAATSIDLNVLVDPALPAGSTISNSATVSSPTDDPDPANNATGLVAAPATPEANLSVTKTAPAAMIAGADAIWTIQVVNGGPSQALDVVVTDTLDPRLTFVSADPAICAAAGQDVTCELGDLPAAGVQTIELTTRAAADAAPGTVISNVATVESPTDDPDPLDNVTPAVPGPPLIAAADLSVTKEAPAELLAGTESTWTITVTNDGPSQAADVVVTDPLDPSLTFVSSTPAICTAAGQDVTCAVGTLGAGVTTSIDVTTSLAADSPDGAVVINTASATSATPDPDPNRNLSPPIAAEVVTQADASIDIDIAPEQVRQGAQLTVNVTVGNLGPSAAVDATAMLSLGQHLLFVADNGGFGAPAATQVSAAAVQAAGEPCSSSGTTLTCAAGTLPPGNTAQAAITVLVSPATPVGTRITFAAEVVTGTVDDLTANNTGQDEVVVVAVPAQPPPTTSPPPPTSTTSPPTTPPTTTPSTTTPPTTTSSPTAADPGTRSSSPFTGLVAGGLVLVAAALIAVGSAAVASARRGRQRPI